MLRRKVQGVACCFSILQPITSRLSKVRSESTSLLGRLFGTYSLFLLSSPVVNSINLKCSKFYTELAIGSMIPLGKTWKWIAYNMNNLLLCANLLLWSDHWCSIFSEKNMDTENVQSGGSTAPDVASSCTQPEGPGYKRENHRLLFVASRILTMRLRNKYLLHWLPKGNI